MIDATKTNAELLDACLAEHARQGWDTDQLRDAVLARMIEPSAAAAVEDANPMALAKLEKVMAEEAVLRERIAAFVAPGEPKRETRVLLVDEIDEWPPGMPRPGASRP